MCVFVSKTTFFHICHAFNSTFYVSSCIQCLKDIFSAYEEQDYYL